jgi:serine/threonine protein kinase
MIDKQTRKRGGKVLGSGGFGCIFRPAIKCKTKKMGQGDKYITKLMKNKHARREYTEINKFKRLLQGIPNYEDYFLLKGFTLCKPDKLTDEDLNQFDKKCSALKKIDITERNVNDNIDKIFALNMPYGGVDIGSYIQVINMNYQDILRLNHRLLKLFKYGVLEMNHRNVYHCDIKESNVLVDNHTCRLIDWGLSASFVPGSSNVPKILTHRPFQFNVPFSLVLFNRFFMKMYVPFLNKNPNPTYENIRSFVISFVVFWIKKRGKGHLKTLNNLFKILFGETTEYASGEFKDNIVEFEYTFYYIFEYLTQILHKFTKNGEFQKMYYFSHVFLKNIDIWGFMTVYFPILEKLNKYYDHLSHSELEIFSKIKELVLFVVSSPCEPISPHAIIYKMSSLNISFNNAIHDSKLQFNLESSSSSSSLT